MGYAISTESVAAAWEQMTPSIAFLVLLSAVCALALNFLGGLVLKDLGASAQQIVGKLNTICIAAISVAFLNEHLPLETLIGTLLVMTGVIVFERGEHQPNVSRDVSSTSLKHAKFQDEDSEEPAE